MITIVDYQAGNLTSVKRALDHLGISCRISADPKVVERSERIIFPGVGHAGTAMYVLKQHGLDKALQSAYLRAIPILGICIGCQIILTHSEEGNTACLDLIPGRCLRFRLHAPELKIPHMGWNSITVNQAHPVLRHLQGGEEFYFVHSYYALPNDPNCTYATCTYGQEFPAAIGNKNLFALQFHVEKSGPVGLELLKNFVEWNGVTGQYNPKQGTKQC